MKTGKNKKQKERKSPLTQKKDFKKTITAVPNNLNPNNLDISNQKNEKQENIPPDQYLYVYGITNNKNMELNFLGLKDQLIQTLEINDLTALFSFYPTLHPLVEEKEALLHAETVNKLADKMTFIPMAFGTVFKDREILKTVLTSSYLQAKKTLELIKDKLELGIKVIKKEHAPEEANRGIVEELNKLSVKSVAGDKFSERLLLNNSFLVEKNRFAQFSDKVGELEQKYPDLKFIYTGPWPAYSFVNINIKVGG